MLPCRGVTIHDMGHKMGCNGVDNAKLSFDRVRVPREGLLDAHSTVAPDGAFASRVGRPRGAFGVVGRWVGFARQVWALARGVRCSFFTRGAAF